MISRQCSSFRMISRDLRVLSRELPCFMLDICELTSFVIRSELMWFHDSIFAEHAFSITVQMKDLGTNLTTLSAKLS